MTTATTSMAGRVCLVTGGSSGIGKETALGLAQQGATVVLVSRDHGRGVAAVNDIQSRSGNSAVSVMVADVSSQAAVRQLAQEFIATGQPLHVLVNNVGAVYTKRVITVDGYELTFALNHLAPFLLTNLLLPVLMRSGTADRAARIVTVSSDAHKGGSINFEDLHGGQRYRSFGAYAQSKLANLLFTYELARRLGAAPIVANAVHPGFVASGFGTNNGPLFRLMLRSLSMFQKTPAQGAQTSVYVASAPEIEGVTRTYFANCTPTRSSKASYNEADARRLWHVSADLTGIASDGTANDD